MRLSVGKKFQMRFNLVEDYRVLSGKMGSSPGSDFGAFFIPGPCGRVLVVIASSGDVDNDIHWEHVSVSTRKACPNWTEMCYIKGLFWGDEETVMQLHPPKSTWINNHLYCLHLWRPFYCLHLWRPLKVNIPVPPQITVGFKELNL